MTDGGPPAYWLRQRAARLADRVDTAEAESIAQRAGVVGDLYGRGLVWQEPDASAYSGWTFVTLTPVWEQR
jgi:hypothetical protein